MTPHRSLPLWPVDGYLPIEDHSLIGDGTAAALVGRDGAVSWLCIPRFDSPPLSCGLLDRVRDGAFTVAPEPLLDNRQWYEEDSVVLVTELRGLDGTLQITDALTLRAGADLTEDAPAGRGELLRRVTVLHGRVRLRVELEPPGTAPSPPDAPRAWRSGCAPAQGLPCIWPAAARWRDSAHPSS